MNFNDLVRFVRAQGCKVKVHKSSKEIEGALGFFIEEPYPLIEIAIRDWSKRRNVSTILHEYGHFCQSREGFSRYLDGICWSLNTFEEWIAGDIKLTKREIKMVRAVMLSIEYDAEMRACKLGDDMKPKNWDREFHLKEAYSYIVSIKWAFKHKKNWKKRPSWKLFPARVLSHEELFAPLTKKEIKILRKITPKK